MPTNVDFSEIQREFGNLNGDLNKNLKTISLFIENLIQNFRNDPEQLNTSNVILMKLNTKKDLKLFSNYLLLFS